MGQVFAIVLEQWQQQSLFEVFAVILSVVYVALAANKSIWCWPAALVSTSLFAYVFWDVSLLFQLFLNLYYLLMAVVGFIHWHKNSDDGFISLNMPIAAHLSIIFGGCALSVLVVFIAETSAGQWFGYELLYLDAAITMFSLLATYLTVNKYLQSWIYWTIINAVSMYLFISSGLYLTAILMVIYIVIAIKGYANWSKNLGLET